MSYSMTYHFSSGCNRDEILAFQTLKLRNISISSFVKWDILLLEDFEDAFSYFHEEGILLGNLDLRVNESNKAFTIPLIQAANEKNLFKTMDLLFNFDEDNMELDLCPGINLNQSLERVKLSCSGTWSNEQLCSLNNLLQTNTTCLKGLSISVFSSIQRQLLYQFLHNNSTLEEISVNLYHGYNEKDVTDLDIDNIISLASRSNLQELEIYLYDKKAKLKNLWSPAIKTLLTESSSLKKFKMEGYYIHMEERLEERLNIDYIVQGLKNNRSLKELALGDLLDDPDDKMVFAKLFSILPDCPSLEKLFLEYSCLSWKALEEVTNMNRLSKPIHLELLGGRIRNPYRQEHYAEVLKSHPELRLYYNINYGKWRDFTIHDEGSYDHINSLNWYGRYLLDRRNVPLSLWVLVFENARLEPSVIYEFLHGPAFAGRESTGGYFEKINHQSVFPNVLCFKEQSILHWSFFDFLAK